MAREYFLSLVSIHPESWQRTKPTLENAFPPGAVILLGQEWFHTWARAPVTAQGGIGPAHPGSAPRKRARHSGKSGGSRTGAWLSCHRDHWKLLKISSCWEALADEMPRRVLGYAEGAWVHFPKIIIVCINCLSSRSQQPIIKVPIMGPWRCTVGRALEL